MRVFNLMIKILLLAASLFAQELPEPYLADVKYGPHELNTLDFWKAESSKPTPLVIYIHGGGFTSGDKSKVPNKLMMSLLSSGISVVSVNYRLTPEVIFPQHYHDCARAIQYLRYNAGELNLDPLKIGLAGSSAGACTALWIAFNDDLADPVNPDPVLKMSTRVNCVGITSGQTTLQPDTIKKIIGELALKHSFMKGAFFGLNAAQMNSAKGIELTRNASPVTYLTRDDPPVWAYYSVAKEPENVSEAIHHLNFGLYLKEKMDQLGIECVIRRPDEIKSYTNDNVEFFISHLTK